MPIGARGRGLGFGVVITGGACEIAIVRIYAYLRPLRFRACVVDGSKAPAIIERIIANWSNAIRNSYACKAGATPERIIAYTQYAIRDGYACKTPAILERRNAYTQYAIRDGYACKTPAIIERIRAYTQYAIRNGYACKTPAIRERPINNRSNSIGNCQLGYEITV